MGGEVDDAVARQPAGRGPSPGWRRGPGRPAFGWRLEPGPGWLRPPRGRRGGEGSGPERRRRDRPATGEGRPAAICGRLSERVARRSSARDEAEGAVTISCSATSGHVLLAGDRQGREGDEVERAVAHHEQALAAEKAGGGLEEEARQLVQGEPGLALGQRLAAGGEEPVGAAGRLLDHRPRRQWKAVERSPGSRAQSTLRSSPRAYSRSRVSAVEHLPLDLSALSGPRRARGPHSGGWPGGSRTAPGRSGSAPGAAPARPEPAVRPRPRPGPGATASPRPR